jgi:hypothetical protein
VQHVNLVKICQKSNNTKQQSLETAHPSSDLKTEYLKTEYLKTEYLKTEYPNILDDLTPALSFVRGVSADDVVNFELYGRLSIFGGKDAGHVNRMTFKDIIQRRSNPSLRVTGHA